MSIAILQHPLGCVCCRITPTIEDIVQCVHIGASDFIQEPLDLPDLKRRLENLLSHSAIHEYSHIERAKAYVEKNYSHDISLEEIASQLGLTPSYFSYIFSKKSGITFVDYLNKVRIEKAKGLLENSDLRISEIAEKVGFHSQDYFYRVFKRLQGISPRAYRYRRR